MSITAEYTTLLTEHTAVRTDMTFSELFEDWLANKEPTVTPRTCEQYASKYRLYLEEPVGGKMVNDITPEQWQEFENSLSASKSSKGKPLSVTLIRKILHLSRVVFAYGEKKYGLNDPTGDNFLPVSNCTSETIFTPDEVGKLRAAVKPYDLHHLGIMLCIYTGLQKGELFGAKWGDVDTDNKLLKIRRSLIRENSRKEHTKTELRSTSIRKDRTFRDVSIPDWINDQLKLIKKMHTDDEFIIVGRLGGVEPNNFVNHYYARFLDSAGVKFRPFLATRNTYAKNSIESGMDFEELSRLLGDPSEEYTREKYYNDEVKA